MSLFSKAVAIATFADIWAGPLPCALVPFTTKRNGVRVIRYRWLADNGAAVGGWASPFQTVKGGVMAASRHARFSEVRDVTPAGWEAAA